MSDSAEKLLGEALKLPESERRALALRLLDGVGDEPETDGEPIDPEDAGAVSAALDRVEAGGELVDGEAWLARWRDRLDAKWRARTG